MQVTAKATRSGNRWAIEVVEIPGLFTQSRRLDQVEGMVRDAAAMLGHQDLEVVVVPNLPPEHADLVNAARQQRQEMRIAQVTTARVNRKAVYMLRDLGLSVRDVATLLGVSPQRISAITQLPAVDPVALRRDIDSVLDMSLERPGLWD